MTYSASAEPGSSWARHLYAALPGRLLRLELRRSAMLWMLPIVGVLFWLGIYRRAMDAAPLWSFRIMRLERDYALQAFGPFVAGAAAWMGSREGRRGTIELVNVTARPRWAARLVTWGATTGYAIGAYLCCVAIFYAINAGQVAWGGPPLWPAAVGITGVAAFSALGFATGALVPSRFTAPLAATVAFLALIMNLWVQPASYRAMRDEMFQIKTDLAAVIVREGEFTEPVPGLTVYAQDVDGRGDMHNLFIHQVRDNGGAVTYMANKGHIAKQRGEAVLILQDGSTQEFSPKGVLQYLTFKEYPFPLSSLDTQDELVHYKPSDRYLHELFFPDLQQGWERKNRKALLAEGHARIASPLYNIAFMALALWAIIGGGFSRLGYGRRMVTAFAVMTTTRVLGFVAQSAAEHTVWVNALQYAVPVLTTWFALRSLFRQKVSRRIDLRRRARRAASSGAPA